MTKRIRELAPKDATHFRVSGLGVTYFKVSRTGNVQVYLDGMGWVRSASGKRWLHALHAPKWLEPALFLLGCIAVVVVGVFYGK